MQKIVVYSQPDCPPCEFSKRFLTEHGFSFEVKDIKKSELARSELTIKYNSYSTPTFVINDDVVITGFDLEKLKKVLHIEDK